MPSRSRGYDAVAGIGFPLTVGPLVEAWPRSAQRLPCQKSPSQNTAHLWDRRQKAWRPGRAGSCVARKPMRRRSLPSRRSGEVARLFTDASVRLARSDDARRQEKSGVQRRELAQLTLEASEDRSLEL